MFEKVSAFAKSLPEQYKIEKTKWRPVNPKAKILNG